MSGTLFVVATPIGNLEDMTYRAVRVLREVALIAAEDTRHSRKLLEHYAIPTALISYHEHNEATRSEQLVAKLKAGESLALISDAGTPCIADPGYRLVSRCRREGIDVAAVPGASALVAALSIAGLPTDGFLFCGFLPSKQQARRRVLEQVAVARQTVVCYETPHRLPACLRDCLKVCGAQREIAVARELTKRHEELFSGTIAAALDYFSAAPVKGELVLLFAPATADRPTESVREALLRLRRTTDLNWKEIVKLVAKEYRLPGSEVYKESLPLRQEE